MRIVFIVMAVVAGLGGVVAQVSPRPSLADIRLRDVCILADERTRTYYAVAATRAPAKAGYRNAGVQACMSKDLVTWEGPTVNPEGTRR